MIHIDIKFLKLAIPFIPILLYIFMLLVLFGSFRTFEINDVIQYHINLFNIQSRSHRDLMILCDTKVGHNS